MAKGIGLKMFSKLKYLSILGLFIAGNVYAQAVSPARVDISIGGTKTANNVNQIDFPQAYFSATQTARKATLSVIAVNKWKVGAVEGTGTVNIVGSGTVSLSATTDGSGNGTITVLSNKIPVNYGTHTGETVTGTTTETVVFQQTITGGTLGLNGQIRTQALLTFTNNVNTKTIKEYLGSATVAQWIAGLGSQSVAMSDCVIANRGSTTSQIIKYNGVSWGMATSTAFATSTVNTGNDQLYKMTVILGSSTDSIKLELLDLFLLNSF